MINDNQVWETQTYVLKIEAIENNFRGVIFRKLDSGSLLFINILIEVPSKPWELHISKLIKKMNFQLTNKSIICKGL